MEPSKHIVGMTKEDELILALQAVLENYFHVFSFERLDDIVGIAMSEVYDVYFPEPIEEPDY